MVRSCRRPACSPSSSRQCSERLRWSWIAVAWSVRGSYECVAAVQVFGECPQRAHCCSFPLRPSCLQRCRALAAPFSPVNSLFFMGFVSACEIVPVPRRRIEDAGLEVASAAPTLNMCGSFLRLCCGKRVGRTHAFLYHYRNIPWYQVVDPDQSTFFVCCHLMDAVLPSAQVSAEAHFLCQCTRIPTLRVSSTQAKPQQNMARCSRASLSPALQSTGGQWRFWFVTFFSRA